MKQRLFCLTLAAALLTGCGVQAAQPETTPEAASGTAPETVASESASAGLHLLYAGDEDGFYSAGSSVDPGLSRVNYVDYTTLTAAPLCDDPECTHDSDTCTACLPEGQILYGVEILDEDRILLLGATAHDYLPLLYTAARDGSGRQLLYESTETAYLSVGDTRFMADDQYLYFCVTEESSQDPALSGGLYRIPLNGGEAQRLFTSTNHTIIGVVGGGILCVFYDLTDPSGTGTRYLRLYSTDGSYTDLMSWTDADPARSFGVDGDRILWMDESGSAGWLKPDGSSGQVSVTWPFTVGTGEGEKLMSLDSRMPVLDGQLLVNATGAGTDLVTDRYALDPESGTLTPLPLSYMAGEMKRPLDLAAVAGDKVLCTFAVNYLPVSTASADGTVLEIEQAEARIGLLSLRDFFAGSPNYEEIRCAVPMAL